MKLYFYSGIAVTLALWAALYFHSGEQAGQYELVDKIIVCVIMVTNFFGAGVMFWSRKDWTFRGSGLFLMSLAVGVLFSLSSYLAWRGPTSLSMRTRKVIINLDRSLFLVGSIMVFAGLTDYSWRRIMHKPQSAISQEWKPGEQERRSGQDRRKEVA